MFKTREDSNTEFLVNCKELQGITKPILSITVPECSAPVMMRYLWVILQFVKPFTPTSSPNMINRLGQRIKENFHETTRDLNLLAGGGGTGSASYFDVSEDKVTEIGKLLDSRAEVERLEGMKRIIAAMSKGRNMEVFFAQVVKNVVASSIEIRKLVYIYLLRYAATNSDLLLLSINTFQKDLSDPSPLIRSMSLRVLTSMRLPVIQGGWNYIYD